MIAGALVVGGAETHGPPAGAGFDLLLLAHVASVIVGLGAVVVCVIQAVRLLSVPTETPLPGTLLRYFSPGTNWVGRALFGVPLFGFALLGASGGAFDLGDAWVMIGLVLWGAAALGAEGLLWPAERRIQAVLSRTGGALAPATYRAPARRIAAVGMMLVVVLVAATVLMVAQP